MKLFIIGLCVIMISVLIITHYTKVIEGAEANLPSGNYTAPVNSVSEMRTFLEQMYTLCILSPNDLSNYDTNHTLGYKIATVGTYIWPVLGPISAKPMEELFASYGATAIPTQMEGVPSLTPPPTPVIAGNLDYLMFMQLCTAANAIQFFVTGENPVWRRQKGKKNSTVIIDYSVNMNTEARAKVALASIYFNAIKSSLEFFHNQSEASKVVHNGDDIDSGVCEPFSPMFEEI